MQPCFSDKGPYFTAWSSTTTYPDTTVAVAETTMLSGAAAGIRKTVTTRKTSGTDPAILEVTTTHTDGLGRIVSTTSGRGHVTKYEYHPNGGQVVNIAQVHKGPTDPNDPDLVTSYAYDLTPLTDDQGAETETRTVTTTLPDMTKQYRMTNILSQTLRQWGSQTNPVKYTYDPAGRLQTQTTYRANVGTSADAFPTIPGDTTTWNYDPSGVLLNKVDPNGGKTTYIYDVAGRLQKRGSARGRITSYHYSNGLLATVDYFGTDDRWATYQGKLADLAALKAEIDPAATAAEIQAAEFAVAAAYDDYVANAATPDLTTPSIAYTRDRLDRLKTVSNGVATSVFEYADDLGVDKETITYALPGRDSFTRVLDRSARSHGRDTGWDLKLPGTNGLVENTEIYTYSGTTGRLESAAGASAGTFNYGYVSGSNLVETVTKPGLPEGQPILKATRSYETTRDALATIANDVLTPNEGTFDTVTRSAYDYTTVNGGTNKLGQRGGVAASFNLGVDASSAPIPATSGNTSWGHDILGQVTAADLPGADIDRAYTFDTIGNRLTSAKGTFATANNVTTFAPGTNALSQYYGAVSDDTPSGPGANALNQYAAIKTGATIVQPVHDDDGNMTHGPLPVSAGANCTLVWDAENRLIEVKNSSGVTLVKYAYDALSRLIASTVGSASTLYCYDGWNRIAEYTGASPAIVKKYLWGIDLSGSTQGAGGVGGLLAATHGTTTYYPTFDGNGNVSEYLTAAGAVAAHFEYDPFGNTVVDTDNPTAPLFSYRFSTKPLDFLTGLYYYGYRYYDPLTGRWPSRDPIEEEGGLNLYGFVRNDAIRTIDPMGRKEYTPRTQQAIGGVNDVVARGNAAWNEETFGGQRLGVYVVIGYYEEKKCENPREIYVVGGYLYPSGGKKEDLPFVSSFFAGDTNAFLLATATEKSVALENEPAKEKTASYTEQGGKHFAVGLRVSLSSIGNEATITAVVSVLPTTDATISPKGNGVFTDPIDGNGKNLGVTWPSSPNDMLALEAKAELRLRSHCCSKSDILSDQGK